MFFFRLGESSGLFAGRGCAGFLGGPVARRAKEGSFGVLVYTETSRDDK